MKELEELLKRGQRAEELLQQVLNWAISNRGTKSEFVACYTYSKSYPRTLADIKAFFREPLRKDYKIVEDRGSQPRTSTKEKRK